MKIKKKNLMKILILKIQVIKLLVSQIIIKINKQNKNHRIYNKIKI